MSFASSPAHESGHATARARATNDRKVDPSRSAGVVHREDGLADAIHAELPFAGELIFRAEDLAVFI